MSRFDVLATPPGGWVVMLAVVTALPAAASGGETIVDPENPAVDDGELQQDEQNEDEGEADDSMIIEDPERPEVPDGPEPARSDEQRTDRGDAPGFRDTEWDLDYQVGTLVDSPVGPQGRDAMELVGSLGMELRHEFDEKTRAVVAGRFGYWAGAGRQFDDWRSHYEPRLSRAYLVHRPGRWSFSFGQMRNSWGSTDLVRPGDVIDPVDLRDPVGPRGLGTPVGQLAATGAYSGGNWSIRGLVVPFFHGNRVSLFGRDTSLIHERNPVVGEQMPFLLAAEQLVDPSIQQDIQPLLQASQRPQALPRNASAGLRASWTVSGTDLGVGMFYGWDRTPWVEMDDDLRELLVLMAEDGQVFEDYDVTGFVMRNPEAARHSDEMSERVEDGESLVDSTFQRRATLLVDAARYIGPIGVRADVAFSPRQVFYTERLEPVHRPGLFGALGLSWERLLDGTRPLAVIVEGFWLHPFGADSGLTRAVVPEQRRGSPEDELLMFGDGYYGVATAGSWATGLWGLEVMAGAVASLQPGDVMGQFSVQRQWFDGVTTRLGTSVFAGPDPADRITPGGLWAHANRVELSVRGRF